MFPCCHRNTNKRFPDRFCSLELNSFMFTMCCMHFAIRSGYQYSFFLQTFFSCFQPALRSRNPFSFTHFFSPFCPQHYTFHVHTVSNIDIFLCSAHSKPASCGHAAPWLLFTFLSAALSPQCKASCWYCDGWREREPGQGEDCCVSERALLPELGQSYSELVWLTAQPAQSLSLWLRDSVCCHKEVTSVSSITTAQLAKQASTVGSSSWQLWS